MIPLALAFPDQERLEVLHEVCWRCDKTALIAKDIPNGVIVFCAACHRECEVRSDSKLDFR